MLRIGNNTRRASTLVEVMIAVAILSSGTMMIYAAFFSSLDAFNHASNRLNALSWMDEKVWQVQDELIRSGVFPAGEHKGSFVKNVKNFKWNMSVNLIGQAQESYLCKLTLTVLWKEAHKNASLSQVAYVQN